MKKVLLMSVVLAFSMMATAQNLGLKFNASPVQNVEKSFSPIAKGFKKIKSETMAFSPASVVNGPKKIAGGSIYGEWIYSGLDEDWNIVNKNTFEETSVTDGEGNIYNVYINGFAKYVFEVIGKYDAEAGTLTVPAGQIVWDNPEAYGECAIFGYNADDEYYSDLVFEEDGDGNLELQNDGYQVLIVNEESQYYHYYIVDETEVMYYKPNAKFSFQAPTNSGYNDVEGVAYVEDFGEELNVYGMFSYVGDASVTSIRLNDDGTAFIDAHQYVDSEDMSQYLYDNYQVTGDFGYLHFVSLVHKVGEDEYYMATEDDLDDEDNILIDRTDPLPGHMNADKTMLDFTPYLFSFATEYVEGAGSLWYSSFKGLKLELTEGTFSIDIISGINSAKVNNTTKSTKLYDLQGRVVDGSYKGIVISNGKKVVVK